MELRTAFFCLLGILCCWTTGYPETYHQYTASADLQRAREQAEIEYWRAVEAKARSLRNTPETEVHRKGGSSLQGENLSLPKARSGEKNRGRERGKTAGDFQDRKPDPDLAELKIVRSRKTKLQAWTNTPASESQRKKRSQSRKENVALK